MPQWLTSSSSSPGPGVGRGPVLDRDVAQTHEHGGGHLVVLTPWSLAMFVLELSKPSGICLAAERRRASSSATSSARATTRSGT